MAAPIEVIFTSEGTGQLWNTCVLDLHSGTTLATYKGGASVPRTLCLLAEQYILSAVHNKSLIHVWSLQKREQLQLKMVCPGRVSGLAVSPEGSYCVAAVDEKLHLWQVCTGNLLLVLSRHYQTVRCIKFTDDGSHFISAGEDHLVLVWNLASVLADVQGKKVDPVHVWSAHSLPVTDVHIGCGGCRARVATASLDHTVKLWDIVSGDLLVSFIYDCSILSVAMDTAEYRLFAGGSNGKIYQANLFEKPVTKEHHIGSEQEETRGLVFTGHSKQVTCLSVNMDSSLLVSGSHDCSVKLWDIQSRQCIRTLAHKGPVTNLVISPTPPGVSSSEWKTSLPLQQFKRQLFTAEDQAEDQTLHIKIKRSKRDEGEKGSSGTFVEHCLLEEGLQTLGSTKGSNSEETHELKAHIAQLQTANKELYQFTMKNILHDKDNST
ncbi:WD repeat-containing protein 18 [Lingula anatina]|uniref:WD repeat-containing protein 18 n=1 Tax=Lingula anatina TaxID=7574 RepID=A0A1S3IZC0_LINAN|nr:WD repeat-containing protein 18 [Lingula anatina]|eukprot:XP_013403336.1 WD repeat-containing protein 18 [Lingula anatina]